MSVFAEKVPHLADMVPYSYDSTVKADLRSLYDSSVTEGIKEKIRATIPRHARDLCLYCGAGNAVGFDHYLSKENYAEFGMFILNLVPCCSTCNSRKGEGTVGRCDFLYPYSALLADQVALNLVAWRWLTAEVHVEDGAPAATFSLNRPAAMNECTWEAIRGHYESLSLLGRFSRKSTEVLTEHAGPRRRLSREEFGEVLLASAHELATMFGTNFWKASLLTAAANSDTYLEAPLP
jgi:hypothetical protein